MSVAEYMHLCLNDPRHGYYPNQTAIGREGDFITAPEISQMFGELIGIWALAIWQAIGKPEPFILAEAGPGKGTLMADLLRATAKHPGFNQSAKIRLIETSPAMIKEQKSRLKAYSNNIEWLDSLDQLEDLPLIFIANEFLDVLPFRQFIKTSKGWLEHCIGLDEIGRLGWVTGAAMPDLQNIPEIANSAPDGTVFEISPAREAWGQMLSKRIVKCGGSALLIDYGHAGSQFGATFQAVRDHKQVDPLDTPGLADLTAHVDFAALQSVSTETGAHASQILTQGEYLQLMGLAERAGTLGADKPENQRAEIRSQAERLVMPEQMGDLFKVMAIISPEMADAVINIPPFSTIDPS
ncbi:MAG: class I SAM-dependent methyltransferase [Pseudomonadota bacterium]